MSAATTNAPHDAELERAFMNRLPRIEGQVRGIERMLEEDRSCVDVLTQIVAVRTALDSFAIRLLEDQIARCDGGDDAAEVLAAVRRFIQIR